MRTLTDLEAAYWAGAMDADGHIGVHRGSSKVALGMNDRDYMLMFLGLFEGEARIYLNKDSPLAKGKTLKPLWQVHLTKNRTKLEFLLQIRPYLKLKGRAADHVLLALYDAQKKNER